MPFDGIAVILGLATRIPSALFIVQLVVATLLVKTGIGLIAPPGAPLPGAESDLALIAGFAALFLLDSGPLSVDRLVGLERTTPVADAVRRGRAEQPVASR
ncbi:MAG: DoxX family protein [Egibacteraceae bacterium]